MAFQVRGVIEGFYGRLWSWTERRSMIDFLGQHGYNLYVYAPKNDPIHRNRWQEPYLPEEVARFGALAAQCQQNGIEFVFGISPLQYHYASEEYWNTLWAKVTALYNVGVRSFTVLLDDMPDKFHHPDDEAKFGNIAKAQVWLNNTVLEKLKALGGGRLLFCPTEYCGEGVSEYLSTLGEGLHPEIDVFWTGTEVCAQYLRTEDARKVSETLKRPVLFWDNYPVNDLEMRFRPHLRPVRGRDADLHTVSRGIVANGGLQPEANKIPLHTYGAYMADPVGYDPDVAWDKALLEICGTEEEARAVAVLGDLTRWSALERGKQLHNKLAPELARFWAAWGGVPAVAGPDLPGTMEVEATTPGDRAQALQNLTSTFAHMQKAADRLLKPMTNQELQRELLPWIQKMDGWVATGRMALEVLYRTAANANDPEIPALREATLDRLLENRENFHWVAGDQIDQFSRRCLWAATMLQNGR